MQATSTFLHGILPPLNDGSAWCNCLLPVLCSCTRLWPWSVTRMFTWSWGPRDGSWQCLLISIRLHYLPSSWEGCDHDEAQLDMWDKRASGWDVCLVASPSVHASGHLLQTHYAGSKKTEPWWQHLQSQSDKGGNALVSFVWSAPHRAVWITLKCMA